MEEREECLSLLTFSVSLSTDYIDGLGARGWVKESDPLPRWKQVPCSHVTSSRSLKLFTDFPPTERSETELRTHIHKSSSALSYTTRGLPLVNQIGGAPLGRAESYETSLPGGRTVGPLLVLRWPLLLKRYPQCWFRKGSTPIKLTSSCNF